MEKNDEETNCTAGKASNSFYFKIRMCPFLSKGHCIKGPSCSFAHSESELLPMKSLKKTTICRFWQLKECVLDSSKCRFAHGSHDLACSHTFKTTPCEDWSKDQSGCPRQERCHKAHGDEELRERDGKCEHCSFTSDALIPTNNTVCLTETFDSLKLQSSSILSNMKDVEVLTQKLASTSSFTTEMDDQTVLARLEEETSVLCRICEGAIHSLEFLNSSSRKFQHRLESNISSPEMVSSTYCSSEENQQQQTQQPHSLQNHTFQKHNQKLLINLQNLQSILSDAIVSGSGGSNNGSAGVTFIAAESEYASNKKTVSASPPSLGIQSNGGGHDPNRRSKTKNIASSSINNHDTNNHNPNATHGFNQYNSNQYPNQHYIHHHAHQTSNNNLSFAADFYSSHPVVVDNNIYNNHNNNRNPKRNMVDNSLSINPLSHLPLNNHQLQKQQKSVSNPKSATSAVELTHHISFSNGNAKVNQSNNNNSKNSGQSITAHHRNMNENTNIPHHQQSQSHHHISNKINNSNSNSNTNKNNITADKMHNPYFKSPQLSTQNNITDSAQQFNAHSSYPNTNATMSCHNTLHVGESHFSLDVPPPPHHHQQQQQQLLQFQSNNNNDTHTSSNSGLNNKHHMSILTNSPSTITSPVGNMSMIMNGFDCSNNNCVIIPDVEAYATHSDSSFQSNNNNQAISYMQKSPFVQHHSNHQHVNSRMANMIQTDSVTDSATTYSSNLPHTQTTNFLNPLLQQDQQQQEQQTQHSFNHQQRQPSQKENKSNNNTNANAGNDVQGSMTHHHNHHHFQSHKNMNMNKNNNHNNVPNKSRDDHLNHQKNNEMDSSSSSLIGAHSVQQFQPSTFNNNNNLNCEQQQLQHKVLEKHQVSDSLINTMRSNFNNEGYHNNEYHETKYLDNNDVSSSNLSMNNHSNSQYPNNQSFAAQNSVLNFTHPLNDHSNSHNCQRNVERYHSHIQNVNNNSIGHVSHSNELMMDSNTGNIANPIMNNGNQKMLVSSNQNQHPPQKMMFFEENSDQQAILPSSSSLHFQQLHHPLSSPPHQPASMHSSFLLIQKQQQQQQQQQQNIHPHHQHKLRNSPLSPKSSSSAATPPSAILINEAHSFPPKHNSTNSIYHKTSNIISTATTTTPTNNTNMKNNIPSVNSTVLVDGDTALSSNGFSPLVSFNMFNNNTAINSGLHQQQQQQQSSNSMYHDSATGISFSPATSINNIHASVATSNNNNNYNNSTTHHSMNQVANSTAYSNVRNSAMSLNAFNHNMNSHDPTNSGTPNYNNNNVCNSLMDQSRLSFHSSHQVSNPPTHILQNNNNNNFILFNDNSMHHNQQQTLFSMALQNGATSSSTSSSAAQNQNQYHQHQLPSLTASPNESMNHFVLNHQQ